VLVVQEVCAVGYRARAWRRMQRGQEWRVGRSDSDPASTGADNDGVVVDGHGGHPWCREVVGRRGVVLLIRAAVLLVTLTSQEYSTSQGNHRLGLFLASVVPNA
jgi:hypothetical protein